MKESKLNEKESVYFISKWVIILAIIITSSISFALGFFVGKSIQPSINQQQIMPQVEEALQQNIPPEENLSVPSSPEKIQDTPQSSDLQSQKDINMQETTSNEQHQTSKPRQPKTEQEAVTSQTKKTEQKPMKLIKYTVQAGAFKNPVEAESLKGNLEKKGYKPYIVLSETKNHEKIYKVRVGEFSTRKEAELLSLRIKKSDGLNTFVTFK